MIGGLSRVVSYIDDHEDLRPLHLRAIVDLHRRVRDGLYLRALRVLTDRELFAIRGCLNFKLLPVELGDLDFLVTDRCGDFRPSTLNEFQNALANYLTMFSDSHTSKIVYIVNITLNNKLLVNPSVKIKYQGTGDP